MANIWSWRICSGLIAVAFCMCYASSESAARIDPDGEPYDDLFAMNKGHREDHSAGGPPYDDILDDLFDEEATKRTHARAGTASSVTRSKNTDSSGSGPRGDTSSDKLSPGKKTAAPGCERGAYEMHYRRLISHVVQEFKRIGFESGRIRMDGYLSPYEVGVLKQFDAGDDTNLHELHDAMVQLLTLRRVSDSGEAEWMPEEFLPFFGSARRPWYQDLLFCCLGGTALAFLALTTYRLMAAVRSNFWQTVKWCILVMFIISVPWEWYRLYTEARSAQMAEMMKGIPEICRPDKDLSVLTNIGMFLKSTFIVSEDPCVKYQRAILVDPLSNVTPAQAISVAVTRLFTDPLVYVFSAIGKCTKALMIELPAVSHLFVAILIPLFVLVLIVLLVLTSQKYSLRVPLLLSVSPTHMPPAIAVHDEEERRALRQEIPEIRRQLAELTRHQQQIQVTLPASTMPAHPLAIHATADTTAHQQQSRGSQSRSPDKRRSHVEDLQSPSQVTSVGPAGTGGTGPDCTVRQRCGDCSDGASVKRSNSNVNSAVGVACINVGHENVNNGDAEMVGEGAHCQETVDTQSQSD